MDRRGRVKCVVWDLDGTLWHGTLLEPGPITPRVENIDVVRRLDEVGVLHSVASRNDTGQAMDKLRELGIEEYFLVPQINWNPKSASVGDVAAALNIGLDSLAFVDDQPFELAEVAYAHPEVLCVPADDIARAVDAPAFRPVIVTDEARRRREMYRSSISRQAAERAFTGTDEAFLRTLDLRMVISRATPEDLLRAQELTVRTNQMNSTGETYTRSDLERLIGSPDHLVLVTSLRDRFGDYGKVGLAVVERDGPTWYLRLLLVSCRVVSRGVGTVLLNHVMSRAAAEGARLRAVFRDTGRNRMMYVTYAFAGFSPVDDVDGAVLLDAPLSDVQRPPDYLDVRVLDAAG